MKITSAKIFNLFINAVRNYPLLYVVAVLRRATTVVGWNIIV
jgi:hypothetical protein